MLVILQTFDIYNFCTDGLQTELRANRLQEEKRLEEIFQKKRALDAEIPKGIVLFEMYRNSKT